MNRRFIGRALIPVFCLALMVTLAACKQPNEYAGSQPDYHDTVQDGAPDENKNIEQEDVQSAYSRGYADGFRDGQLSSADGPNSVETGTSEEQGEKNPTASPSGFVVVTDVVPDVILEIRYYSTYNFVGERIPGYEQPIALLTAEAASALKEASDDFLQQGYQIKIYDAYRPQTAVNFFETWATNLDDTRMKDFFYPQLDKSELFEQGYVASKSGHSRGSTVDLTLIDMDTGREVDMGGTFDFFGELSHFTYTATLTEKQIENRTILHDTMLEHGFRALDTEWWHFTLVDEPYPDTYFDFPVKYLDSD